MKCAIFTKVHVSLSKLNVDTVAITKQCQIP